MIRLLFALAIILPYLSAASAAESVSTDDAVNALAALLKPRVQSLDRDLVTFHYQMAQSSFRFSNHGQVVRHLKASPGRFYNSNLFNSDMMGIGLYMAIDPSATRSYGGSDPHLFIVPVKKGTRFLNVSASPEGDEFVRAKKIYSDLGCDVAGASTRFDSFGSLPGVFRNSTLPLCREVIIRAFFKLGIQAILYGYQASALKDGCRDRGEAINLVDPSAIRDDMVALYTDTEKIEGTKMARYVSHLYAAAGMDFTTRLFSGDQVKEAPPKVLKDLTAYYQAQRSWTRRSIFKCGPAWSLESLGDNEMSYSFLEKLKKSYADKEIQDAEIAWMRAWQKRLVNANLSSGVFAKINEIEKAVFETTGLPSFEKFQAAVDVLEDYSLDDTVRNKKAAELLGETYKVPSFANNPALFSGIMNQLTKEKGKFPGIFPAAMRMAGAGPSMTRLQFNLFSPMLGGPVLLTREMPFGSSASDHELIEQSKKKFLMILRKCTAMMQSSELSNDELQKSSCGVRSGKLN